MILEKISIENQNSHIVPKFRNNSIRYYIFLIMEPPIHVQPVLALPNSVILSTIVLRVTSLTTSIILFLSHPHLVCSKALNKNNGCIMVTMHSSASLPTSLSTSKIHHILRPRRSPRPRQSRRPPAARNSALDR